MPAPDDERLQILSEEVARLLRRQRELEERVRALESQKTPEPVVELVMAPPPLPTFEPPAPKRERQEAVAQPPPEPVPLETTLGLNWINRIAVFTLLLGVAFLFKYGVDNEWFGPSLRVALGVAAAIISLLAGDHLWRRNQTVFAQGIIGLGLALLYLSIYASAILYHLLPQSLAFMAMCGVTAGAAALALRYNSQAVAAIAMIGGYLTPPALSSGEDHPWILFGYVFLLNLGGLLLARKRRWKALEPIAAAATILLYWDWFNEESFGSLREVKRPAATVFAFVFWAQFGFATVSGLWAVFQLGASMALAIIWTEQAHFVWWNLLLAAGALANASRRPWIWAPIWTLGCYWLPFWIWYSPDAQFAAISAVFLIFFAWSLWRMRDRVLDLALIAANAAVYYAASYSLLNPSHHQYMGLLAAAIGGVHLQLARRYQSQSAAQTFTIGVALALITLAVPIQFAGFRVTIAWAF
ncbi:MAG: rane protein, partial [Bryobacterales bacterium]|nr:rane protein [Bryobacterales bacterium]